MIPSSHLLIGFALGRLARRAVTRQAPPPRPWQDPLVAAAIAASVFPDWDVAPGLLAGYEGVQFHRGATHSPVGVVVQAFLMAPVGMALWSWLRERFPRLGLAGVRRPRALVLVLLAGMGLHALTDALNPWGVAPWWPLSRDGQTWNLVHEGDLGFLAVAAACAFVAVLASARMIAVFAGVAFAALLIWKADRRAEAMAQAERELGGQAVSIYPSPAPDCPWSALVAQGGVLSAACVDPNRSDGFRIVRTVTSAQSPLVEASKANPSVVDFLDKRAFPFADVEPAPDGGAVVLWRDLRESLLEGPGDPRFGLAVRFDRQGRIAAVEHRWMLKVSF